MCERRRTDDTIFFGWSSLKGRAERNTYRTVSLRAYRANGWEWSEKVPKQQHNRYHTTIRYTILQSQRGMEVGFTTARVTFDKFWARSGQELSQISTEELLIISIWGACSIGHPPLSSASPVNLRLRVRRAPRAQWKKKKNKGTRGEQIYLYVSP